MSKFATLSLAVSLAACGGNLATQEADSVDLAETGLTAANYAGAAYIKGPTCDLTCATKVQAAAKVANADFLQLKAGAMTLQQFTAALTAYQAVIKPAS